MIIRTPEDLQQPKMLEEDVEVLSSPKIIWVNDSAIARDFPKPWAETASVEESESRELRRRFIVENAKIISTPLANENVVTEGVKTTGEKRRAMRPPRYGRALVTRAYPLGLDLLHRDISTSSIGLLDIKGVGIAQGLIPKIADYRTGTLQLDIAIAELINQMIIEEIMRRLNLDVCGVPVYAILDLGFYARNHDRKNLTRCAALVRSGHRRPANGLDLPFFGSDDQLVQIMIELILRLHGISSTRSDSLTFMIGRNKNGLCYASYAGKPVRGMLPKHAEKLLTNLGITLAAGEHMSFQACNVQIAHGCVHSPLSARMVDFFQYKPIKDYDRPLLSLVKDRALNWGGVIWPDDELRMRTHMQRDCLNMKILQNRSLKDDLCDWIGVEPGMQVHGSEYLGYELARGIESDNISPEELASILDDIIDSAFIETSSGISKSQLTPFNLDLLPTLSSALPL